MTDNNADDLFGPPKSKNPNKGISHEDLWNTAAIPAEGPGKGTLRSRNGTLFHRNSS